MTLAGLTNEKSVINQIKTTTIHCVILYEITLVLRMVIVATINPTLVKWKTQLLIAVY